MIDPQRLQGTSSHFKPVQEFNNKNQSLTPSPRQWIEDMPVRSHLIRTQFSPILKTIPEKQKNAQALKHLEGLAEVIAKSLIEEEEEIERAWFSDQREVAPWVEDFLMRTALQNEKKAKLKNFPGFYFETYENESVPSQVEKSHQSTNEFTNSIEEESMHKTAPNHVQGLIQKFEENNLVKKFEDKSKSILRSSLKKVAPPASPRTTQPQVKVPEKNDGGGQNQNRGGVQEFIKQLENNPKLSSSPFFAQSSPKANFENYEKSSAEIAPGQEEYKSDLQPSIMMMKNRPRSPGRRAPSRLKSGQNLVPAPEGLQESSGEATQPGGRIKPQAFRTSSVKYQANMERDPRIALEQMLSGIEPPAPQPEEAVQTREQEITITKINRSTSAASLDSVFAEGTQRKFSNATNRAPSTESLGNQQQQPLPIEAKVVLPKASRVLKEELRAERPAENITFIEVSEPPAKKKGQTRWAKFQAKKRELRAEERPAENVIFTEVSEPPAKKKGQMRWAKFQAKKKKLRVEEKPAKNVTSTEVSEPSAKKKDQNGWAKFQARVAAFFRRRKKVKEKETPNEKRDSEKNTEPVTFANLETEKSWFEDDLTHFYIAEKVEELKRAEELKNKEAELQQRAEALKNREAKLQQSSESLQNKEAKLQQSSESLKNREAKLQQSSESLQNKEAEFQQRAEVLKNKETELQHREERIKKQDEAIQQGWAILKLEIKEMEEEIAVIKEVEEKMELAQKAQESTVISLKNAVRALNELISRTQASYQKQLQEPRPSLGIFKNQLERLEKASKQLASAIDSLEINPHNQLQVEASPAIPGVEEENTGGTVFNPEFKIARRSWIELAQFPTP
ncbi:MAG: hypothetical protein C5B47_08445 [Verrucomicrobia bacterium]|nr:MAG: hypothetical protein C5B47_08445 [Verrucomicrobiota bacterium]